MNESEQRIIKSRLTGFSFSQLDGKDKKISADKIMLNGAAISGCHLPATDFFASIIAEELIIFITDFGYGNLTEEEILLAFRFNSKGNLKLPSGINVEEVPFVGNCFNIDYMAKILYNYMILRTHIDRKIENHIDGY